MKRQATNDGFKPGDLLIWPAPVVVWRRPNDDVIDDWLAGKQVADDHPVRVAAGELPLVLSVFHSKKRTWIMVLTADGLAWVWVRSQGR